MNASVTVSLPAALFLKAEAWANQTGRPLSEFLVETIELSLVPFASNPDSIKDWTDQNVLEQLDRQPSLTDDDRLSELLNQQAEGLLSSSDSAELRRLMTMYQQSLLMKSAALREAVQRGLRQPPGP
jgi:hypothetical protein